MAVIISTRRRRANLHISCTQTRRRSYKMPLKGQLFLINVEVQQAVLSFLKQMKNGVYESGMFNPLKQWDDILNAQAHLAQLA